MSMYKECWEKSFYKCVVVRNSHMHGLHTTPVATKMLKCALIKVEVISGKHQRLESHKAIQGSPHGHLRG